MDKWLVWLEGQVIEAARRDGHAVGSVAEALAVGWLTLDDWIVLLGKLAFLQGSKRVAPKGTWRDAEACSRMLRQLDAPGQGVTVRALSIAMGWTAQQTVRAVEDLKAQRCAEERLHFVAPLNPPDTTTKRWHFGAVKHKGN